MSIMSHSHVERKLIASINVIAEHDRLHILTEIGAFDSESSGTRPHLKFFCNRGAEENGRDVLLDFIHALVEQPLQQAIDRTFDLSDLPCRLRIGCDDKGVVPRNRNRNRIVDRLSKTADECESVADGAGELCCTASVRLNHFGAGIYEMREIAMLFNVTECSESEFEVTSHLCSAHLSTLALPARHQTERLNIADCLANRVPADAVPLTECLFGRQKTPNRISAVGNPVDNVVRNFAVKQTVFSPGRIERHIKDHSQRLSCRVRRLGIRQPVRFSNFLSLRPMKRSALRRWPIFNSPTSRAVCHLRTKRTTDASGVFLAPGFSSTGIDTMDVARFGGSRTTLAGSKEVRGSR